MKQMVGLLIFLSFHFNARAQDVVAADSNLLLRDLAESACNCVDSIDLYNRSKEEVLAEISRCIDVEAGAFQLGSKLFGAGELAKAAQEADSTKKRTISVELDKNSEEYKEYYFELERYLMDHCESLKIKVASFDEQHQQSVSKDSIARSFYELGLAEVRKENYQKAIAYFKQALEADESFAFAWDNLGLCYRKLEDYDEAIRAYQRSLAIDAKGLMPLQNIAVAYRFKKEYEKAIAAYKTLALVDKDNPEVYYGIGAIYVFDLKDFEPGLKNLCKAYNLYIEQKSPYRADAEKVISVVFSEMKKQGKEARFYELLKANHITPQE